MKFIVNREAFFEVIKPAMELAGRKVGNYDDDVYSAMTSPLDKDKSEKEMGEWLRNGLNSFRRISFYAHMNRLIITSTDGIVTLVTTVAGNDLVPLGYKCKETGVLTLESARFWIAMESLDRYDRLIFSCDDSAIATIQSEKRGAVRRFEKCFYHVSPHTDKNLRFAGAVNTRILSDGIHNVKFVFQLKNFKGEQRDIIAHLCSNNIRLIAANCHLAAMNNITLEKDICKKNIRFAMSRDVTISLMKFLSKLNKDSEVEIWHGSKPRTGDKPWTIVFKQDETVLSVVASNPIAKHTLLEEMTGYDFKYKACTKTEDWKTLLTPKIVSKFPFTTIKADFVDGYFHIRQQASGKTDSYVPFNYDTEVAYVDVKSIRDEEVTFKVRSIALAAVFKKAGSPDTLQIEFGKNASEANERVSYWILMKYPIMKNKSRRTRHQIIALFSKIIRKEDFND